MSGPDETDARLIAQIARAYAPPARTALQHRALEAALRERLEQRRGPGPGVLAVAGAALALALGATWMAGLRDPAPAAATAAQPVAATATGDLGEALLALAGDDETEADAGFPEEYLAIEELLIEGGA